MSHETSSLSVEPGYAVVEKSIEALDQEANTAWLMAEAAYTAGTDEEKQRIDELQADYQSTIAVAANKGYDSPSLSSLLLANDGIPEGFTAGILAYEACNAQLIAAEGELETHASDKAADVKLLAEQLEARLDFDRIVTVAFSDEDEPKPDLPASGAHVSSINILYDASEIIGVRKLLEGGVTPTYRQLRSIERKLHTRTSEFADKGLIRDESFEKEEPTGIVYTAEQAADIETYIREVDSTRIKYKRFDGTIFGKIKRVQNLTRLLRTDQPISTVDDVLHSSGVILNDGLREAISSRLAQGLSELPAEEFELDATSDAYTHLVEKARNIDVTEALDGIEVSGSLENLPFEYSEAELKKFLRETIPPIALASIKRIVFRPMTTDEDKDDTDLGLHRWSEELGGSEIVISDVKVREHYQEMLGMVGQKDDVEAIARDAASRNMHITIAHECAHELHQVLPVAALKRWEDQRATDPTNVTAYVKEQHDTNHRHRYWEDFADSVGLFTNRPEVLDIISSTRFSALRQIYEEYMSLYPVELKHTQDHAISFSMMARLSMGMSEQDVRDVYLSHEAA